MLQYNGKRRLSAEELLKHPFLCKNVRDFTKIDTRRVSKKITNNKDLNINVKQNKTIWSIFNEEKQLANIKGAKDLPAPEGPIGEDYNVRNKRSKTEKNIPRIPHNTHIIPIKTKIIKKQIHLNIHLLIVIYQEEHPFMVKICIQICQEINKCQECKCPE